MILLLMYCQASGSLMLHHDDYVIHLTSSQPIGILSHIITRRENAVWEDILREG